MNYQNSNLYPHIYCSRAISSFIPHTARLFYFIVRFLPGNLGSFLRVASLRWHGIQIGRSVHIGLGTVFHLPAYPMSANVLIGDRVSIDEYCDISAGVYIGDDVCIGKFVSFIASPPHSITIGDDCLIAKGCFVRTDDHIFTSTKRPYRLQGRKGSSITIGPNVWLGAHVVVLKGSSIGANSVIGASALVNSNIPANSVAVGTPARMIKTIEDISC
jgi:acetyltransferase-like isoleucine patch superfamily enzyme